jgi:hypothetical protein
MFYIARVDASLHGSMQVVMLLRQSLLDGAAVDLADVH